MMENKNSVVLVGFVGHDANYYGEGANRVAHISVATNTSWTDQTTGELKSTTEWNKVVIFGPLATEYDNIKKGQSIIVEGRLTTTKYTPKGKSEPVKSTQVIANILTVGDSNTSQTSNSAAPSRAVPKFDGFDDEIPF